MLHYLKNHEIHPYFWRLRGMTQGGKMRVNIGFLDLKKLKNFLIQSPRDAESDLILEKTLYGGFRSDDQRFSGWTAGRLERVLRSTGFALDQDLESKDQVFSIAKIKAVSFSSVRVMGKRWERVGQKTWNFRKSLRSKVKEWRSKFFGVLKPVSVPPKGAWLNLGAGGENYRGYIKVDMAGEQHVYDNIVSLKKISNQSVSRIYCNHVLEHLPREVVDASLRRWHEVLENGGVIYARMPDARSCIEHLDEKWEEAPIPEIEKLGLPNYLEKEQHHTGVLDENACIQSVYGWSEASPHHWDAVNQHKTLWTPALAKQRFERAGFKVEVASNFGDLNTLIVARKA